MEYKEYKAPDGKVLFNIDSFTYGNTCVSCHDLNLIVMDKEEAERIYIEYVETSKRLEEKRLEKERLKLENKYSIKQDENNNVKAKSKLRNLVEDNIQTMELNENGEYIVTEQDETIKENVEEDKDKELDMYKSNILSNLLLNGAKVNDSSINCIVKTTKHI